MMQRLATAIREQMKPLIDLYDARLCTIPGYANLPDATRHDLEQSMLEMVAHCLDVGDDRELVQYVQQRAEQVKAQGFDLEWFQRAVAVPEEVLVPLLETVEESNFLWRAMQHAQNVVWQIIAAGRKQIEESLRASEERYQTIFDSTPVMFWLKDTHNRTLRINRAAAAFEGVRPEDVEGKAASELYPPEQADAYYQDDLAVIQSGQPKVGIIEQHSRIGTGEPMWVQTGKVPVRTDQGEIIGVLAFAVDITDRKQAEQRAQQSLERRARQVQITTQVAQEIALARDLNELFKRVVTLIKERFDYYHTQIFRYDAALGTVVLVAGYGEAGQAMLAAGHRLPMGHGVVGAAAAKGQSILASDVSSDPDWQPNPHLPATRGEVAVPIIFRNEVLGILDVQSDQSGALTDDDRLLLEGLCGQIAIAIEHQRAEEAIKVEQQRTQTILETVAVPMIISRLSDSKVLYANQALAQFRHMVLDELIGSRTVDYFVNSDERNRLVEILQRQGYANDFETQLRGSGGRVSWVLLSARIISYQNETCVLTTYVDITERKLAEEAVRAAHAELAKAMDDVLQFKTAFDHTSIGMAIVTTDGRFMSVNQALCDLVGYTPDELQSKRFGELTHPDDVSSSLAYLRQALSGEINAFRTEKRYLHKSGEVVWVELSSSLLRDTNNQPLYFISQMHDIRQRRQAEEALHTHQTQLSEALRIAHLAYWEYDVDHDLFQFNDHFYAIFHTTAEAEGGYQMSSARYAQKFVHPDDAALVGLEIGRALASTDRRYTRQLEHRILYADGGVGYITVRLTIERDEHGHILRYYGANQDITERKLAELEGERARQQMEEAMHEAQRLYAAVSREGWQNYRQAGNLPQGYRFDRTLVEPAPDVWLPELSQAVAGQALVTSQTGHQSAAVTPLEIRGEVIGALGVIDDPDHPMQADDLALVKAVSEQVALALESARLFEQTQRDAERERTLNRITGRIRSAQSVEQVLEFAAEELSAVTHASRSVVEIRPDQHAPGPARRGNGNKDVL